MIFAIDSHRRYQDNVFQENDTKRICIGSVQGSFSIELIKALSWCTVITAANVVPDASPAVNLRIWEFTIVEAWRTGPNYN